eukprot:COSAG02_NODE_271_length_26364_cov_13.423018_12_plen_195_part_00
MQIYIQTCGGALGGAGAVLHAVLSRCLRRLCGGAMAAQGAEGAEDAAAAVPGRLTRQGRTDPRYSVKFEDMFSSRLNRGGALPTLVPFTSHFKGFLKHRQQFAVNLGFWCLAERRCDCSVDPCACGSLVPFDSCASSRSTVAALLSSLVPAADQRATDVTGAMRATESAMSSGRPERASRKSSTTRAYVQCSRR